MNYRSLVLEATTLPTEPQPLLWYLPTSVCFDFGQSYHLLRFQPKVPVRGEFEPETVSYRYLISYL